MARTLCLTIGYRRVHQSGSHIILQTDEPTHQRLAVPSHAALRIGTLDAILRSVAQAQGMSKSDVLSALAPNL